MLYRYICVECTHLNLHIPTAIDFSGPFAKVGVDLNLRENSLNEAL